MGIWEVWCAEESDLWAATTLPHCVNGDNACDPNQPYFRGQSWYRTRLAVYNPFEGGRTNQKGFVERDLTKKEIYFVFQSFWAEKPMAHIYGHSWSVRWGKAGKERQVRVYSNCDHAELFLNRRSMGTKKRDSQDFPSAGPRWMVQFAPGKNHLRTLAARGSVTGAAIPNATVVYKQTQTNCERQTKTDARGAYRVSSFPSAPTLRWLRAAVPLCLQPKQTALCLALFTDLPAEGNALALQHPGELWHATAIHARALNGRQLRWRFYPQDPAVH